MSRLIPFVIALVAIAALTVVEGVISERWGDNRLCAYCVTLIKDQVPKEIGSWTGIDGEVDGKTQEVAGARGYVSRTYVNSANQDQVGLWLIVGHARDTARHTPDVCYKGNGFDNEGITKHRLTLDDGRVADFFTTIFTKQSPTGQMVQERVYWAWFCPRGGSESPVNWIAPDNVRMEIAAAPALYKIYFSTRGDAAELPHEESPCLEFAKEFFATVDPLLAPANGSIPSDFDASTVEEI